LRTLETYWLSRPTYQLSPRQGTSRALPQEADKPRSSPSQKDFFSTPDTSLNRYLPKTYYEPTTYISGHSMKTTLET